MEHATQALLQADLLLAEEVITDYEGIVLRAAEAEERAFSLLALQAPVAGDLRAVVSSIGNVADVDRMGALALHVAKLARRRHPAKALPEEVNGYFTEMGRIAVDMGNSVKDVVLSGDPEKAAQLDDDDDDMDNLHRHLFTRTHGSRVETRRRNRRRRNLAQPLLRAICRSRRRNRPPRHLPSHGRIRWHCRIRDDRRPTVSGFALVLGTVLLMVLHTWKYRH